MPSTEIQKTSSGNIFTKYKKENALHGGSFKYIKTISRQSTFIFPLRHTLRQKINTDRKSIKR